MGYQIVSRFRNDPIFARLKWWFYGRPWHVIPGREAVKANVTRVGFILRVRRIDLHQPREVIVKIRVILADDHPFVPLGVRAALETHASVTIVGEAATPTSLIKLLQRTPCDVLVTDLTMPEASGAVEDGLNLVRRIRVGWSLLRIVVMTAPTNTAILRAIVSDGVVSALSKMETMDELWQAIEAGGRGDVYVGRSIIEALAQPEDEACDLPPVSRLSRRQAEVISMFVRGQSISEIADVLGDPTALAGVDMIFVSEDVVLPASVGSGSRIICLTEKPKPTGYRILDNNVRVSINPISWRGLGAACAAAMTGLPSVAPRPAGMPRVAEGATVPPDRERAIASGRLILVAEDHPVNQELIRHQLALLGFACDVTNDGAEALAALEQTSYGCLITDCHMPNVSGYELARRIREQEQGGAHHLLILGITANTAPEDLKLCRDAGMDDCLVKPTRLATLRDYLSRWFGTDSAWQTTPAETVSAPLVSGPDARGGPETFVPVDLGHMTQ